MNVTEFDVLIGKYLGVCPTDARRYVLHVYVGMGFGVVASILGEHGVATLLLIAAPTTALFRVWLTRRRDFESNLAARRQYENTDIKALAAPFETLLNQHNGVIVTAHTYGIAGPIIVFRAPIQIAQWLNQIVSTTRFGRTKITYFWGLSASFDPHCNDRFVWRLETNDYRFDIKNDRFAFDAVKFAADFEAIAAELAKLIQANASGMS